MNIVFRTDASRKIGSGHVMRCLTLADELRRQGADVMFICRELSGNLISLIKGKGYRVACLPQSTIDNAEGGEGGAHVALLNVPREQDAMETIAAFEGKQMHWLVVDHYALDRGWEQVMRPFFGKIMVIDDLADRCHDCDLLLDQNLYQGMETRYDALVPAECTKLIGPRYALLRPEFAIARKIAHQRDGVIRRILVFFGGVDQTNETYKALQALAGIIDQRLKVDVVVGGSNPHKEDIRNFCSAHNGFTYHCQVTNMAELMAASDLAIGGGGSTTWERCAVGLPAIVVVLADNQKELAESGARNGLLLNLGDAHHVSVDNILNVLRCTLLLPKTMQHYSMNCLATVDAKGVSRVANCLLPLEVTLRRASHEDCDLMYEWRNAEETRKYTFNHAPIPLETHRKWFYDTIENKSRVLLIGQIANKPLGVLRYDLTDHEALVSVYLVPGGQGQGRGAHLLRCGSQWLRENYPEIRVVNAEIFRENAASLRAFELAGFNEHHRIFQEIL